MEGYTYIPGPSSELLRDQGSEACTSCAPGVQGESADTASAAPSSTPGREMSGQPSSQSACPHCSHCCPLCLPHQLGLWDTKGKRSLQAPEGGFSCLGQGRPRPGSRVFQKDATGLGWHLALAPGQPAQAVGPAGAARAGPQVELSDLASTLSPEEPGAPSPPILRAVCLFWYFGKEFSHSDPRAGVIHELPHLPPHPQGLPYLSHLHCSTLSITLLSPEVIH